VILNGLLDQCDALDGVKDGMIANVAACHFRPAALICAPGNSKIA
jgi:feruloyl esterase